MPTNKSENKSIPKKELRYTAKEMAEHKSCIELVCGKLAVLPIYAKKHVYTTLCHLLGIVPETDKKKKQFNTDIPPVGNSPAPAAGPAPKPAKIKWQKSEIGKVLKITSHMSAKYELDGTERTGDQIGQWLNVGGAVGAAIKRGVTKCRDNPSIIAGIDEIKLDGANPTDVVEGLGKLFQDSEWTPLTQAQRDERRRLNKEAKAKKKTESKDTSSA